MACRAREGDMSADEPLFERMALIGLGLLGSSLARVAKREVLVRHVAGSTRSRETLERAFELGFLTVFMKRHGRRWRAPTLWSCVPRSAPTATCSGDCTGTEARCYRDRCRFGETGRCARCRTAYSEGVHLVQVIPSLGRNSPVPCGFRRTVREPLLHLAPAARNGSAGRRAGCGILAPYR